MRSNQSVPLLCFLILAFFIGQTVIAEKELLQAESFRALSKAPSSGARFERVPAASSGLDFVHRWDPPKKFRRMLDHSFAGGGVCTGDYDGDGLPDIFLTRPAGGNRLYRNLGDFRFEDVSDKAGILPDAWGTGASFADIDNDGDLDLLCSTFRQPLHVYINNGDGTFTERAKELGLGFSGASTMISFADFDRDGDLDAYLLTNHDPPPLDLEVDVIKKNGVVQIPEQHREVRDVIVLEDGDIKVIAAGQYDHFYRNDGKGRFEEVTSEAGFKGNYFGLSATWWDYNQDGWPDLYVANDFYGPDQLYKNNGDGTFSEISRFALPHTPWYSMGSDAADLNNDGLLDFIATDMSGTTHYDRKVAMGDMSANAWFLDYGEPRQYMRNAVYLNTGTDRFQESAYLMGLADSDWTWSVKGADFDNDGRVDVYVSNGMTRDWFDSDTRSKAHALGGLKTEEGLTFWLNQGPRRARNMLFHNSGDMHFSNIAEEWGLDYSGVSFGAAMADFDLDGDLDLVVNNFDEEAHLYRNHNQTGHQIKVKLRGTKSNRFGIDATVTIQTAAGPQVRYMTLARGFMAADEPVLHFGLGDAKSVEQLTVKWPSGHEQSFAGLEADRLYTISEPSTPAPVLPVAGKRPSAKSTMFFGSHVKSIQHRERDFNDFKYQPLLPNRVSRMGPGMAWGDIDKDGDSDLFMGGAAGQPSQLFRNLGKGRFDPIKVEIFEKHELFEDLGAVFVDVDKDDDLDLFIASGGVECRPDSRLLNDRLYLNDGKGGFSLAPGGSVQDYRDNSSAVAACDFDRDGLIDLFVGGRSVPGAYPEVSSSRLLRHSGKSFIDEAGTRAKGLGKAGLVSGAVWTDYDGDGWNDLVVAYEWGPVRIWKNEQGTLRDVTREAGIEDITGWWNSVAAGDIDGDGDIDLVAGNVGHNTKYHASIDHPVRLYYGDFDKTGKKRIIEADYEGETLFPIRGKSCSTRAIPSLGDKFKTFSQFAKASLTDIYTSECVENAEISLEANTLDTGVFINRGDGRFSFQPLPEIVQIAPCFGIVLEDFNSDGNLDIFTGQNFHSPQLETGNYDGGVSQLLLGDGKGGFIPVSPADSGLIVAGDAMSVTLVDVNSDRAVDIVVSRNNSTLLAFLNRQTEASQVLSVRLEGARGNLTGIGSQIIAHYASGKTVLRELQGGGGYLSQSEPTAGFPLPGYEVIEKLEVRWSHGQRSTHAVDPKWRFITVHDPSR